MRARGWLAAAVFLAACGVAEVESQRELFFGDLAIGEQRDVALLLVNSGEAPVTLTFESSSAEFTPLEPSRTVAAGESASVHIRFSPADLGPRTGQLIVASSLGTSFISLSGRGTGPRLAAPAQVWLPRAALVSGQAAEVVSTTLTLQNTGTLGSRLVLQPPRVHGAELCVGTFVDSRCEPWSPPATLETQTMLEVPLALRATSPGPRRFTVVFESNDVLHPAVSVEVGALVEAYEPCVFSAPSEVVLTGEQQELRVTHVGPGACLVRSATITATPPASLRLGTQTFPQRLDSRASLSLWIGTNLLVSGARSGVVRVFAAGTAPLEIPIRYEPPASRCLVISPSVFDFGSVNVGCNSPNRNVQLYNSCSTPLTITSLELAVAAGEGPGGPNCPGTAPCPEFFLVSTVANGTVIPPGSSTPVTFTVKYRPMNYGPDTGALLVHTPGEVGPLILALAGRGGSSGRSVDTFRQDTMPIVDVLVMVDPSPSFVPRRAEVRANLASWFGRIEALCWDGRIGFAAADLDPDAGVELLANDVGAPWTSSRESGFVDRALSAFDSLPIGSELEGCVGPAAGVMQDAGVRDGGSLAGMCITDALEQTPSPMAALQALQGTLPLARFTWSAVTGVAPSACAIEAADDGVHQTLVAASNGARADVCTPSWWWSFVPLGSFGCSQRTSFFLTSRSAGPFDVRIDGQPVPSADWTYDVTNNTITFVPGREPAPGQTLVVEYIAQCVP